jgi:secondary thiamine-phosphate synthase enzyme
VSGYSNKTFLALWHHFRTHRFQWGNRSGGTLYTKASTKHAKLKPRNIFQQCKTIKQLGKNSAMSNFKVVNKKFSFNTKGEIDFIDLSDKVQQEVALSGIKNGIVHVFAPHATGVLILTENDYALLNDIKAFLEETVPKHEAYQHPSNAHSHLRSMLLPPDKTLPIIDGQVEFGTWQALLFVETDVYPRKRTVIIQVMGEQ